MNTFKTIRFPLFLALLLALTTLTQCKKDQFITDPNATLDFSADTILFDTVFTTVGSATKWLKIYNPHNQKLLINTIELANGSASLFRLNVDGIPGYSHSDIELPAGDSLYIFVEVTVDPLGVNTPMVVTDSIVFEVNGTIQDVDLVAWGQDAYFYGAVGSAYYLSCNSLWQNDKPHVIYGYAVLDTACTLTIEEGTQVHLHESSALITLKDSKLDVRGQPGNEVVFQGDRLETWYEELPGQWGFIQLIENDESSINWAIIKNGNVGLVVDGTTSPGTDCLILENTIIHDMSAVGLLTRLEAEMTAENCLFYDGGQYTAGITSGGQCNFTHCTFGNYWDFGVRQTPCFVLNNWIELPSSINQYDMDHYFYNCIFYGSNANEFTIDTLSGTTNDFLFESCIIRSDETSVSDPSHFSNVILNPGTVFWDGESRDVFIDGDNRNYRPYPGSPGRDTGNSAFSLPKDIENSDRWDGLPDIGAYEL